jgi:hypothetical protein
MNTPNIEMLIDCAKMIAASIGVATPPDITLRDMFEDVLFGRQIMDAAAKHLVTQDEAVNLVLAHTQTALTDDYSSDSVKAVFSSKATMSCVRRALFGGSDLPGSRSSVSTHVAIVEFVKRHYPEAQVDVKEFPSGGVCIDICLGKTFVTVQHSASEGFGVSRIESDDLDFSGHDHVFARAADVMTHLSTILHRPRTMST